MPQLDRHAAARPRPVVAFLTALVAFVLAFCACAAPRQAVAASPVDGLIEQAQSLSEVLPQLEDAIKSGDSDTLKSCTQTIQSAVDSMRESLAGGMWSVASFVPVLGGDVTKARELLNQADDLVDNALAPLSEALQEYPFTALVTDGVLNTDAVSRYAEVVSQVQPVFARVSEGIDKIGAFTVGQLNEALDKIREPLDSLSKALATYKDIVASLPDLIGCNGARTYLIVAQNNAELRATGGFPGAWGTVTVENGQVTLGGFTTLVARRDVTFDLTDEEYALFGDGMATSPGSLNVTPDFPRAAGLMAQAWEAYQEQAVDGVIAMDPRFLQDMLALVGGVTASDGTVVDGTNAAQVLLNDTYWRLGSDGAAQDVFFAEVAGLAADQVMNNLANVNFADFFDTLRTDVNAGRLLVWSADEGVEAALKNSSISGTLGYDAANPVLGVYINDNTWAKICWYLTTDTQVSGSTTNADGTVTYDVTTTFMNTITAEEAADAPTYITGDSPAKRSKDDMFIQPLLVAPAGGFISDVACAGTGVGGFEEYTLYEHDVWKGAINLGAQENMTVTYKVTVVADAAELEVFHTPLGQGE